jgi:hypothetical protein
MSTPLVLTAQPRRVTRALRGKTFFPADDDFDEARRAWNLAAGQQPAAVVFPEPAQDVAGARQIRNGQRITAQALATTPPHSGRSATQCC